MTIADIRKQATDKMAKSVETLKHDLAKVRTGRAHTGLIDHLAEVGARVAGVAPEPDDWHGSMATTPADLAPFTADDLDEARSRLRRLAQLWEVRLRAMSDEQLDAKTSDAWTFRQVAFHVAESNYYADAVGDLSS